MVSLASRCAAGVGAALAVVVLGGLACGPTRTTGACATLIDGYATEAVRAVTDSERAFALGICLYRTDRYLEAGQMFGAAARLSNQQQIRADALHNLGNAAALGGRLDEALQAYRASLRLHDRESTRRNFEIVMARAVEAGARARAAERQERDERLLDAARQFEVPATRDGRPGGHRRGPDW